MTRTEASLLGFLRRAEEQSVATEWPARGARRTTVDLSGTHRENERTVALRVAVKRGLPVEVGQLRRNLWRRCDVFW